MNNGELYVFGESIADEPSQNFIPNYFKVQYKNYKDKKENDGKYVCIVYYLYLYFFRNLRRYNILKDHIQNSIEQ